MNNTIWKFPLKAEETQAIEMPVGARILSAGMDPQGTLCVWAEVEPFKDLTEFRKVWVIGTGHTLGPDNPRFLGSVLMGPFIWHVYCDRGEPLPPLPIPPKGPKPDKQE